MSQKKQPLTSEKPGQREKENSTRRQDLINRMADKVLAEGLDNLALRGLAAWLGTSDRMLLYYFKTKNLLLHAVLEEVNTRLAAILTRESEGPRLTAAQFLTRALTLSADPAVAPFMRVWTDVVARGAQGQTPYDDIARTTVQAWVGWINARLLPAGTEAEGKNRATLLLAFVEGLTLLAQVSPEAQHASGPESVKTLQILFGAPA